MSPGPVSKPFRPRVVRYRSLQGMHTLVPMDSSHRHLGRRTPMHNHKPFRSVHRRSSLEEIIPTFSRFRLCLCTVLVPFSCSNERSTPFSRRYRRSHRSTVVAWRLLSLIEVLQDLSNLRNALLLIFWSLDVIQRVRLLEQHGIVDDDASLMPAGWKAVHNKVSLGIVYHIRNQRVHTFGRRSQRPPGLL